MSMAINEPTGEGSQAQDVRPIVKTGPQSDWGMWAFGLLLLIGGGVLYNAISASEDEVQAPSVFAPEEVPGARIASPPPLRTPERFEGRDAAPERTEPAVVQPIVPRQPIIMPPVNQPVPFVPRQAPDPEPQGFDERDAQFTDRPEVVFQASSSRVAADPRAAIREDDDPGRVNADRLLNPGYTIPQGTVIQAVLETALDSTRAGGVRALVQRDVFSFDGTRVLIPRGSRLYGEYEANLSPGQNRALVQWTRLIRPDGVTIALDSPSSDPLGRAGVRGRVDTKFFQRFGGAILQTVLDIGTGLAINEATDGVFIAFPGSTQTVQIAEPETIQPTLKVRHGTSVSVFVARDLDFSSVDR